MATQKEISEHLDLSERHLRRLIKSGVVPATKGNGGYQIDDCRLAYIRYLRASVNGQVKPDTDDDLDDERERIDTEYERGRKLKAEADAQEMKNAITRREQAPTPLLEWALAKMAEQVSGVLASIPMKIKKRLPHMKTSEVEIIHREIVKCQNAASKSQLPWDQLDSD